VLFIIVRVLPARSTIAATINNGVFIGDLDPRLCREPIGL